MNNNFIRAPRLIFGVLLSCLLFRCSPSETSSNYTDVEAEELKNYEVVIGKENSELGVPVMLKYEEATGHLFIYDPLQQTIFEKDSSGSNVATYGGEGRGPGEIQGVDNFFITNSYIYILDPVQYFIHKYNRSGDVISTLDYGKLLLQENENADSDSRRPPPPKPILVDINNDPFVTLNGNVLIPSLNEGKSLFKLVNWQGEHLADIGEIPEGYKSSMEEEAIRTAVENHEVPARDLHRTFPVNDPADPGELFLVYSAIPKIAKYDTSGQKLWEHTVPATPEMDSLTNGVYNITEKYSYLPPVKKYAWGAASQNGDLFLSTFTDGVSPEEQPLWVHHFNSEGNLLNRYKMVSTNTLSYYPGLDVRGHRVFVSLRQGVEIRSYSF